MDHGADSYRRFLEGDDGGCVEIIRDYKDGLILYLNSFVSNLHTAEELAEDTFVKLVIRKPKYSGKSSFKTWLYAIGRNVAIDSMRRLGKTASVTEEELMRLGREEKSLEQSYIQEERKRMLHNALKKLKSEYRQVLWLVYFEGFRHKEAAAVMHRSVHSIETLTYRARQALKTKLIQEGFDDEKLSNHGGGCIPPQG